MNTRKGRTAMEKDLNDEVQSILEKMDESLLLMVIAFLRYVKDREES